MRSHRGRFGRALVLAGAIVLAMLACTSEGGTGALFSLTTTTSPSPSTSPRSSHSPSPEPFSSPSISPYPSFGPGSRVPYLVVEVVDGDTIKARFAGPGPLGIDPPTIRLIGVDSPETTGECFAKKASQFTASRLLDEVVELEGDVDPDDKYDRILAYVWIGTELFNDTLLRQGYATVLTVQPNVKYVDWFKAAQGHAKSTSLGLWKACVAPPPTTPPPPPPPSIKPPPQQNCDPSYPDFCIPPPPPDLDCADIGATDFTVRQPDPHGFDGDEDGIGCES